MKILVLGTSGLDLLARPLKQAMARRASSEPEIVIGAYGQWQESLLRSSSDPDPDLILVVLDPDDLLAPALDGLDHIAGVAAELPETTVAALENGLDTYPASHLVVTTLFPPTGHMLGALADNLLPGLDLLVEEFNRTLRRWTAGEPRAHLLGVHRLLLQHGRTTMRDARLWAHARCRFSREGLGHLASEVALVWDAIHGRARKCLVLDLDNTLWGGIAGDEGLTGIDLGHEGVGLAYRELQHRLRRLRALGVLLAVASKNDETTVWSIIAGHPDMVLTRDDFTAWRIGWGDKVDSLVEIAGEIGIGLDALVFLDDNPAERERVRGALPEVAVPEWPAEVTSLPEFVEEVATRYFNRISLVEEDLHKAEQYQAQAKRVRAQDASESLEAFLKSLAMTSRLLGPEPAYLPRFAQLTQKTNQFNLTTRRYTEAQLKDLAGQGDWIVIGADLEDRFGHNGIVALAMAERSSPQEWRIDNFLLSCRVIGRTLEQALLFGLGQWIRERGGRVLRAEYRPTERNQVVRELWSKLGFTAAGAGPDGTTWWSLRLTDDEPRESPFVRMASGIPGDGTSRP